MYRVLIADDEELELKAMHFFLERNYPEAVLLPDAQDGTQVIETVTKENPELLILDIEMPGLNGLQALTILRERGYEGHVIVKTAYGKFTYAKDALHLHVDAYLLKPVRKSELKEQMDEVLSKIEAERKQDTGREKKGEFTSGFILSLCFAKEDSQCLSDAGKIKRLSQEAAGKLSLFCDFTICPAEGNVLPILIYTSSAMDEEGYRKLSGDVEEMMSQICRTVFGMTPEMKAGFLIAGIEERLPRQLQLQEQGADKAGEQGNAASGSLHLQRAVQYIGEHYIENISLEDIAEHTKLSTSYLSHLFRQELHKNFVDYLTEVRMEQARRLIDQGIDNVNVLAEKVGYQYASYFCRQFKKYTGMTVGEYKRRK